MNHKRHFMTLGIVGLMISLAMFFLLKTVGVEYDLTPYVIPWIVFLIIGISKRKYVSN